MFCIRYGYYNTKDLKCAQYHDPIADTWNNAVTHLGRIMYSGDQNEATQEFVEFAKLYNA